MRKTKTLTNLERSERVVSAIVAFLMEQGFKDGSLSFDSLNLDDEHRSFFDTSVRWLLDEGIIRAVNHIEVIKGTSELDRPVLTSKGFLLLNQRVDFMEGAERVGEVVKKTALNEGSYSKLGSLIGGVLGGFTKSIG